MIYTYILKCFNRQYYTGITNNLNRRLQEHKTGKSKSTKYQRPVELVHVILNKDRKAARRLEVKIKNMGAKKWIGHSRSEV